MKSQACIKAVIWDMGGVFIKTEDPTPRSRLAERLGITRQQLEDLVFWKLESASAAEKGIISQDVHWERVRAHFDLTNEALKNFIADFWGGDRLDLLLVDYVHSLKKNYRTALISNAWSDARANISHNFPAFFEIFDESVFSAEIGMVKPDPEIFHWMLERLDCHPAEAIFIDDILRNVEGARSVGMKAIQYLNTPQVIRDLNTMLTSEGCR